MINNLHTHSFNLRAEKRFKELAAAYSKMTGKDDDEENDDGGAFYVDPYDIFEMIFLQKISGGGGFGFSRSQKRGMARADLPQHFDPMDIFGELFSVPNAGPRRKGFYPRKSVSQKGKATVKVESDDEDEDEDDDGGDEDEDEENEDEEEGDEDEIEEEDEGDKDEDDDDARVRR